MPGRKRGRDEQKIGCYLYLRDSFHDRYAVLALCPRADDFIYFYRYLSGRLCLVFDLPKIEGMGRMSAANEGTPRTQMIYDERFIEDRVEKIPFSGCWIWMRSIGNKGYGNVAVGNKGWLAHRLSFSIFNRGLPGGLHVCHRCDVPSCVNPDHLFLGTDRDNLLDSINKGRRPKTGPTRGQCKNAHLTQEQADVVKSAINRRAGTLAQLATELGLSIHILKGISRGRTY